VLARRHQAAATAFRRSGEPTEPRQFDAFQPDSCCVTPGNKIGTKPSTSPPPQNLPLAFGVALAFAAAPAAPSGAKSVNTSLQNGAFSKSVILLQITWLGHGCTNEKAPYGSDR
jgi:hypothetical protein